MHSFVHHKKIYKMVPSRACHRVRTPRFNIAVIAPQRTMSIPLTTSQ